jgi:hypothetical protein
LQETQNNFQAPIVRASPTVLIMRSSTVKLDEEKPKYASLDQENVFGSA